MHVDTLDPDREFAKHAVALTFASGLVEYNEDFRTGRTLFSKGALTAEEIDLPASCSCHLLLIRQRQAGRSDCAIRFTR
jgi:hypothetical protein